MKSVIYEELVQDIRNIAATRDLSSGDITVLSDASWLIESLQSRLESLEKDAALLDWLGTAPAGCIRMDTNPFAPTYINYSASGGDIRSALTKAMQANKGV